MKLKQNSINNGNQKKAALIGAWPFFYAICLAGVICTGRINHFFQKVLPLTAEPALMTIPLPLQSARESAGSS